MANHTSTRFDTSLHHLQDLLMQMGKLTEQQLTHISQYLQNSANESVLIDVQTLEEQVNDYQSAINKEAISLIAMRAPVAGDLRLITACERIAIDLERIGDEISKVAHFMARDEVDTNSKLWRELRPTMRLAQSILSDALNMLARLDIQAAQKIFQDDSLLDDNYSSVMRQLLTYMLEDPRNITQSVDIMFAAKALERVGDHCMNIAEAILYYATGDDLRHP
ncbi:phosphate signaling complex protein PhoU [Rappaport israeli]|uniref:phosphate signaling complex protein PhoU n=1 Tax=Rappaport israeli TaxID=1839807 RepID=UPI0009302468|nr:phosphate signaling complex protein PhoU [Rappaport israeli]